MKLLVLLFTALCSLNILAADIKCEARHEYMKNNFPVRDAWPMEVHSQLTNTLYQYAAPNAFYSINIDSTDGSYLMAINFGPDYTRGSLSSGKLEEGGNNLTLSVVDGFEIHKIFCVRN